jgi:hypothetical protein
MNGIVIYIVIFFLLFSILNYKYLKEKMERELNSKRQELLDVDNFFYTSKFLKASKRRKIWIYIEFEKNSRLWQSFGSRSSTKLNLAYMNLCIKSIIDVCAETYDIIIFSDVDINQILEEDFDYTKLSGDLLDKYRHISLMKILDKYGGVMVPPSLFLKKNISVIDNENVWYVCDVNNVDNSSIFKRTTSACLTGSNANNTHLKKYIEHLYKDNDPNFTENYFVANRIPYIDGEVIGTKDANGKGILLERLMSTEPIIYSENNIGLYMPHDQLVKRKIYNWFCKMNEQQVLNTNCNFSYYMLNTVNLS